MLLLTLIMVISNYLRYNYVEANQVGEISWRKYGQKNTLTGNSFKLIKKEMVSLV